MLHFSLPVAGFVGDSFCVNSTFPEWKSRGVAQQPFKTQPGFVSQQTFGK